MGGDSWGVFVGVTPPPPSPFTSLEIPVDRLHQFLNKILSFTLHLKTPHWPLRIFNNPLGGEYEYLTFSRRALYQLAHF